MVDPKAPESSNGFFSDIITEMFTSPLNLILVAVIAFLVYKIFQSRYKVPEAVVAEKSQNLPPKLRKDFTLEELKNYDGKQPCGRILVAVNGKVFDVTKGKQFYGPGNNFTLLCQNLPSALQNNILSFLSTFLKVLVFYTVVILILYNLGRITDCNIGVYK